MVKPEQPQIEHLLGIVISIEGNLITIVDPRGNEYTMEVPEQGLQGFPVGDITTLVVEQPGAAGEEPENPATELECRLRGITEQDG